MNYEPAKQALIDAIRSNDYKQAADIVNQTPMQMAMELLIGLATEVSILRRGR